MPTARVLPLATLCLAFGVANAQPAAVLNVTTNARVAALGGAFVLSVAESEAIFYQPGLTDGARGFSLSRAWLGDASAISVSGAGEWFGGGLGVGVQAFSAGSRGEQVASLAYGRSTMFGFRVGAVAKVADQSDAGGHETYGLADVGIARALGPAVLGLAARNLGPDPNFAAGEGRMPTVVTFGAATRTRPIGPFDFLLTARTSFPRDGDFTFGGGAELAYWPISGRTFTARIGFVDGDDSATDPLTFGGGFAGDRITIDYAFQAGEGGSSGDLHRVTLRWR